jgi:hypothetical protein
MVTGREREREDKINTRQNNCLKRNLTVLHIPMKEKRHKKAFQAAKGILKSKAF